jgi:hypothetical protein
MHATQYFRLQVTYGNSPSKGHPIRANKRLMGSNPALPKASTWTMRRTDRALHSAHKRSPLLSTSLHIMGSLLRNLQCLVITPCAAIAQ